MTIEVKAYAKLNLSLDVLRRREDGYHQLKMVAQTVDLCDDIIIEPIDIPKFSVQSNRSYLPTNERNLAAATARRFFTCTGVWQGGAKIALHKRIPVCAGLGGGSADAGAVLRGLNEAFGQPLTNAGLHEMAACIGSDVPFCVTGGTQLMEGRGEVLTPLSPLPDCTVVIIKPPIALATPKVFGWLQVAKLQHHPDTEGIMTALQEADVHGVAHRVYNVLEDVVAKRIREIADLHKALIDFGAVGASMTGTGSAVYGVFTEEQMALKAAELLRDKGRYEVFITRPVGTMF